MEYLYKHSCLSSLCINFFIINLGFFPFLIFVLIVAVIFQNVIY